MRKDAETTRTALDQVSQDVVAPEARKDVDTARSAVGRINDQLDKYIAQLKSAEALTGDIYDGGGNTQL